MSPRSILLGSLVMLGGAGGTPAVHGNDPYAALEFEYTGGPYEHETFHYRLLRPAKIESGKTYPLVLFLHGAGERGDDNEKQLQYLPELMATEAHRAKYPCFVLAPQCRTEKKWVDAAWGEQESSPMAKEPTHQMRVAYAALQQTLAEDPVDADRVYLTGLSMGGFGAWELAARHPEVFAAVAPICGGGDEAQARKIAKLPIWAFHGEADTAVPLVRTTRTVEALRAAGGEPKLTTYPGVGHNSWTPAYEQSGLLEWMFEQRRKKK